MDADNIGHKTQNKDKQNKQTHHRKLKRLINRYTVKFLVCFYCNNGFFTVEARDRESQRLCQLCMF